ncbi:MAG: methylated-DNA--[protein]-cysteine S-methyltransferase [Sphingomonas sp.]
MKDARAIPPSDDRSAAGRLAIRLLGDFSAVVDGQAIVPERWPSLRAAHLVQLLGLAPRRRLGREQVVEQLWPQLDPEAGAANLRKAAHHARQALGRHEAVVLQGGEVTLWPHGDVVVDADVFEQQARAALAAGDASACTGAAAAYAGDLLPGARYEAWSEAARERLRDTYLRLLAQCLDAPDAPLSALDALGADARAALADGGSVTQALHAAGFGSSGRFYAGAPGMLGMTPARYRRGGAGETLRFAVGECSLGAILVASSETGVAAILLGADAATLLGDLQRRFPAATLIGGDADYEALVARVVAFVEAPATGLDLPLDVRGTAFQQRVWRALQAVPAGRTVSYAGIAQAIGAPAAVRAVAGACAANAHAVAIPCHRVVRTDGGLSGYRWGLDRKRALIDREAE